MVAVGVDDQLVQSDANALDVSGRPVGHSELPFLLALWPVVGLGGLFVEVLRDVSFRIIPLERRDAIEMIEETKGYPLLKGYRGKEPVNLSVLVDMILSVSDWVGKNHSVKELELNPVFAYKQGALAVDARILLSRVELSE